MEWYLQVLQKYTAFDGRARRKEYWMFTLISGLIAIGLVVVESLVGGPGILALLYWLAVLLPSIAVSIRRLHDTGRPGWWLLLGLIPFVGGIIVLVLMVLEGDAEQNEYGPNPKG